MLQTNNTIFNNGVVGLGPWFSPVSAGLRYQSRDGGIKLGNQVKIRNFLVAHGTTKRHATEGRHWVEQLNPSVASDKNNYDYLFISDVRYDDYPKDEVYWLKEEAGGKLIHISQFELKPMPYETVKVFREPANNEEARNDPRLKEAADYNVIWEFNTDLINKDKYISSIVVQFVEWLDTQQDGQR